MFRNLSISSAIDKDKKTPYDRIEFMKKLSTLATTTITFASFATQAFASSGTSVGNTCPGNGFINLCFTANQLGGVIGSFITFAFVLVGLIALVFLAWGGLKWLLSQGEKQAVEEARNHIIAAVVGLIVIFLSYLIVNVVLGFVTGGAVSLNTLSIPTLGHP